VPTRRVKFVRVEVIKASLLIRTTTVHYIIGVALSNVRLLWVIRDRCNRSCQPVDVRFGPKPTEMQRGHESTLMEWSGRAPASRVANLARHTKDKEHRHVP